MEMQVGLLYPPIVGPKKELLKGMAGRRTDLYQTMLKHLLEQAQYVDEHGYYGIGFTEHHLQVEGMTLSTSPGMLDLFIGLNTKNIRVGSLGYVLPAHNPIRVAEEISIIDQMTQGRVFAGFARGIQTRWVNTLGQHFEGIADNITDPESHYRIKREVYDESIEVIQKALRQDLFSYRGKYFDIPPPNINWPAGKFTAELGGGIDDQGRIVEVGIAPPTYNKRIPDMFEPFTTSEKGVEICASKGLIPLGIMTHPQYIEEQLMAAQRGWAQAGEDVALGEKFGLTRYVIVADTDEKARELAANATWEWTYYFTMFNFHGALIKPGECLSDIPNTVDGLIDRQMLFCGSADTVCRQMEAALSKTPIEYLWILSQNELVPQFDAMRGLELMTEKVFPHFTSLVR